jgi:ATP-binding cassette subfamily C protein
MGSVLTTTIHVFIRLTTLINKLIKVLVLSIILGTLGYLCAIFLVVIGVYMLLAQLDLVPIGQIHSWGIALFSFAFFRGILRYFEQLSGHYLAFKVLAVVRDKVFATLRKLAPAKMEQRGQGELISAITNDIELLEVFYAHTLAPCSIALLVSVTMTIFICSQHIILGLIALAGYLFIGVYLPIMNSKSRAKAGVEYKKKFEDASNSILDKIGGLTEIIKFQHQEQSKSELRLLTDAMTENQGALKKLESTNSAVTDIAVLIISGSILFIGSWLFINGFLDFPKLLLAVLGSISSFGPVIAISSLSNDLTYTSAAGQRILALLDEAPEIQDVCKGENIFYKNCQCSTVDFSYDGTPVLKDFSLSLPSQGMIGVSGKSGSGKTTLLKLLMRFWDVNRGSITFSEKDIRQINTQCLRDIEAYETQETILFEDSLLNNIRLSKPDASIEEVQIAAHKANVDEFINKLPNGYQTTLGELGDGISSGERQRIALARVFLHDAQLILMDEPTSNLDGLNEAMVLRSLKNVSKEKCVVLVSHRESVLFVADSVFNFSGNESS